MPTFFTRLTSGAVLVLVLPAIVAAAAAPATTPEQRITARKMTIANGSQTNVQYRVNDLPLPEAARYQALEFAENQAQKILDVQALGRIYDRNETRVALLQAPSLTIYPAGRFAGPAYGKGAVPAAVGTFPCDPGYYYQVFADVERAYLDVLNLERSRQGLAPLAAPQPVPVAARAAGAPAPAPAPTGAPAPAGVAAQPDANAALIGQIRNAQAVALANAAAFRQVAATTAVTRATNPPVAFGPASQEAAQFTPQALLYAPLGALIALAGLLYFNL
jgi:hypothetical protein